MSTTGQKLKVFLSWSGTRSRLAAEAMHSWLPLVLQSVQPYFTPEDIEKGARWSAEIRQELSSCDFGIIFLTPENQNSPWILFEAGALSKLENSRVAPVLIGLEPTDVSGPLSQLQLSGDSREDIFKLIKAINVGIGELALDSSRLEKIFAALWPDLEFHFKKARENHGPTPHVTKRSDRDLLEEIVESLRGIERSRTNDTLRSIADLQRQLAPYRTVSPANIQVNDLPLSERARTILLENGLHTVSDILATSEIELLKLPNFGRMSLTELKVTLHEMGYSLG